MKKIMTIFGAIMFTSGILVGCGPSASDPCDCWNNREGTSDFDAQLAKDCDEYESTLSYQEKLDRLGEIDSRGCVDYSK
jgi:hypothetical protein